eukprot:1463568-Amphidinium_carterae.1
MTYWNVLISKGHKGYYALNSAKPPYPASHAQRLNNKDRAFAVMLGGYKSYTVSINYSEAWRITKLGNHTLLTNVNIKALQMIGEASTSVCNKGCMLHYCDCKAHHRAVRSAWQPAYRMLQWLVPH